MNKPEILSPVGCMSALIAAVDGGADAVYLGLNDELNARRTAVSFRYDELKEACTYCRERGVRVYLTLNTVCYNSELKAASKIIKIAAESGVSAIIVQDLGIISLVKRICPDMPIHASTQMSVHSISGAKFLRHLGISRVVLARELSLVEIEKIIKKVDIETEVFVHGALCMSLSGGCYMSSFLGGRSGNRGLCAAPCRLPFKAKNGTGYDLSLKDLSLLQRISQLAKIGVTSLKIEGRLKSDDYVRHSTYAVYRAVNGESLGEQEELLKNIFSRSGFTDGYLDGKTGRHMFGTRTNSDKQLTLEVKKTQKTENNLEFPFNKEAIALWKPKIDYTAITLPKTMNRKAQPTKPELIIRLRSANLLSRFIQDNCHKIIIPLEGVENIHAKQKSDRLVLDMPRVLWGDVEKATRSYLEVARKRGITRVRVGSLDTLQLAREYGFEIMGGYTLNCTNTLAAMELSKLGVSTLELSCEISSKSISEICNSDFSDNPRPKLGVIAYGHIPLMVFRSCPLRNGMDCKSCSQRGGFLKDRKGISFYVGCRFGVSELYNSVPLYMADQQTQLSSCDFLMLYFNREEIGQIEQVIRDYQKESPPPQQFSRGRFMTGAK